MWTEEIDNDNGIVLRRIGYDGYVVIKDDSRIGKVMRDLATDSWVASSNNDTLGRFRLLDEAVDRVVAEAP